jgi:hypothetical protein
LSHRRCREPEISYVDRGARIAVQGSLRLGRAKRS